MVRIELLPAQNAEADETEVASQMVAVPGLFYKSLAVGAHLDSFTLRHFRVELIDMLAARDLGVPRLVSEDAKFKHALVAFDAVLESPPLERLRTPRVLAIDHHGVVQLTEGLTKLFVLL